MSNPDNITKLEVAKRTGSPEMAELLRELADRVEAGEIGEVAVVGHDLVSGDYFNNGIWEDRWRMVGAIEHVKHYVATYAR